MTTKDWTGNSKAIYSCHGASNHSDTEREVNDYYATPPSAVEMLLELENFSQAIMEPACGQGHIAEVLKSHGYTVCAMDITDDDLFYSYQIDMANYCCPVCHTTFGRSDWNNFKGKDKPNIEEVSYPDVYEGCLKQKVIWE
jgi:hypothetical protein